MESKCYDCDAWDADQEGCTMPCYDKCYACLQEVAETRERTD